MTDKEKAKAYDEAIEKARKLATDLPNGRNDRIYHIWDLESIFPELKESKDEQIRKELITFFQRFPYTNLYDAGLNAKDVLAWLEKQGDKCLVNFDEAEQEKYDFVSGQYIECRASFNEFKEDNSYWLEYIGDDNYIGRSDNILNQKFHITPRQLFTLFTWQHCPKDNDVNDEANAPTEYGKYVDECLNEASKHFFSDGEDAYSVADLFYAGVRCGKSWFEKQTEQKSSTQFKPKFNVGEWIVDKSGFVQQVLDFRGGIYTCTYNSFTILCESDYHLWTIQDAKDGDVLAFDNDTIVIFKDLYNSTTFHSYCHIEDGVFDVSEDNLPDWWEGKGFYPATKEQRDLLFLKMHEAGYEWNADTKELKKIEQKSDSFCKEHCKGYQETGKCFADGECKAKREAEQKPAWSEDDERMLHTIIADFKGFIRDNTSTLESHFNECIDWLQSLKGRVQPEQEWSEEDEEHIDSLLKRLDALCRNKFERTRFAISEDRDWLESLRPQNTWKPSDDEIEKASQEWDSKANFNPFYMTMNGDKPTGVTQDITTHKESFKAGVEWILKKIGF